MITAVGWKNILSNELRSKEFKEILNRIEKDSQFYEIYPKKEDIFKAFNLCDYENVKVVILGQDPYHNKNQATGLAFAVPDDKFPKPPSLRNIFSEIGLKKDKSSLEGWAKQGVLLLNTVLTVRKNKPLSHRGFGWEKFTDTVITKLNYKKDPVIFLLWGKEAQNKLSLIDRRKHIVFMAAHPSPYSVKNFFGCDHFKKANQILKNPINWNKVT